MCRFFIVLVSGRKDATVEECATLGNFHGKNVVITSLVHAEGDLA